MELKKKFFGQYLIISIFVFSIVFTLIAEFVIQINHIKNYKEEIADIEREIKIVDEKIDNIESCKSYKTDEELEYLARNRLGMVKKNEIIYLEK